MNKSEQQTRMKGDCPVYKKCGGCQLQNLSYAEQLSLKQRKVISLLGKFCHVDEITGMENPYHYRNKVSAAFGTVPGGEIVSGVYQSSTHRIVKTDSCLIEDIKAGEIILTIRKLLKSFKLFPFDEKTGKGFLRHVLIKRGFATDEIMVVLVTAVPMFKSKQSFVNALLGRHPEITTVIQNVNDRFTSMVLGERESVLYGKGYIEDVLCGCRFRISSKSFYQINPVQTEKLYGKAVELADLSGGETVLDAYCGIGTIGIIASKHAKHVLGTEINPDAVRDAIKNAKLNSADNIYFVCEDAQVTMQKLAASDDRADVVFLDPPRAGCSMSFLSSLVKFDPEKIVYISCNPETQGRDMLYLSKNGYRVKKICPVDMFPHTSHVETVCLLSKLHADHHIEVERNLNEMDLTSAESKATYDEIKAYVSEHSGLKVSSLYISQVKRKLGLEVGANYNLPKSEYKKQPQCPADKEAAIMEAFRYFKMV